MRTTTRIYLTMGVAAAMLTACSGSPAEPVDDPTTQPRLAALASFYPLQYVTSIVGGDEVEVVSLTPPGADPHDLELSPRQVRTVAEADLVVYLSGLQPSVDQAVAARTPSHVLDAADVVDLLPGHVGHDDHDHDHDHDHGPLDPHFWLDPTRLAQLAHPIADLLADADPSGAAGYESRATDLVTDLHALDEELSTGLARCEHDVFVTAHSAFGYLAHRYDLHQVGISGLDPDAEPSPARLREVGAIARDEGVTTIFFERLVNPKVAQTLAADLGLEAAVLDPVEGLAAEVTDYRDAMEQNLAALRNALVCA